jgi:hypothetical protein
LSAGLGFVRTWLSIEEQHEVADRIDIAIVLIVSGISEGPTSTVCNSIGKIKIDVVRIGVEATVLMSPLKWF